MDDTMLSKVKRNWSFESGIYMKIIERKNYLNRLIRLKDTPDMDKEECKRLEELL